MDDKATGEPLALAQNTVDKAVVVKAVVTTLESKAIEDVVMEEAVEYCIPCRIQRGSRTTQQRMWTGGWHMTQCPRRQRTAADDNALAVTTP